MSKVIKMEQIYDGKSKKLYATNDPKLIIVYYKDDVTAFNNEKKSIILGKGIINNQITNYIFKMLENKYVPTHLIEEISERETILKKVSIIPIEVIIRNVAAGNFSKRMGINEGKKFITPILEFSYKNDYLGDPFINNYYAIALEIATKEDIETITNYAFKINKFLIQFFKGVNIDLIDFKIEFGKTLDGTIILADEISPDTCRFWDSTTHEKLDKDRFRHGISGVEKAYQEIMKRLMGGK